MAAVLRWAAFAVVFMLAWVGVNRGLDRFTSDLTLAFTRARQ